MWCAIFENDIVYRDEDTDSKRVLLVGPVSETEPIIREMIAHSNEYIPIAVIDPGLNMRGYRVYDVPIMGGISQNSTCRRAK